jgi:hypothetical protein
MIPLPDDVMSVGAVGSRAFFKAKGGNIDTLFVEAVAATPSLAAHMTSAEPLGPLTACADYSYDSHSYVGENHILVGDAAAFIHPLFSSGVMMAMSSAAFAATAVESLLEGKQPRERVVRDYERKIRLSLTSLSWLIYRINAPILRDLLVSSFDLFNTQHELITVLAGDFYDRRRFLSPLRRLQLAYGCLVVLSKFCFRLRGNGIAWGRQPAGRPDGHCTEPTENQHVALRRGTTGGYPHEGANLGGCSRSFAGCDTGKCRKLSRQYPEGHREWSGRHGSRARLRARRPPLLLLFRRLAWARLVPLRLRMAPGHRLGWRLRLEQLELRTL